MEVEVKFAIAGDLEPAQIDACDLRPYRLRSQGVEEHHDILLDTASRRITGRHYGLRIRETNGALKLTLKGPNTVAGGVHERQEWEVELATTDDPLHVDLWPEPLVRLTRDLIGAQPLVPLLHVVVKRRLWEVKRGARLIGELALDTGVILAAGRHENIHELELELKGSGARADLDSLSAALSAQLPLMAETRSKLQRGLALLRRARWTMDGYTPIVALARHYVRQKWRVALQKQHAVIKVGDADSIHDMRVAIRRIRSVLQEFEDLSVFKRGATSRLRKRLRGVARQLGAVRDLDIVAERVKRFGNADGQEPHVGRKNDGQAVEIARASGRVDARPHGWVAQVEPILARLATRRKNAYDELLAVLECDEFVGLKGRLARCKIARLDEYGMPSCAGAREFIGGMLWSRYDEMLRHAQAIELGNTGEMHQARILAKRMRYTLELFAPVLPLQAEPLRQALVNFQEAFGALQDLIVTHQQLIAMCKIDAPPSPAVMRSLAVEQARARDHARDVWRALADPQIRATLASVVAAL
jgi:inorganic triphosphatase YgiF